MSEMFRSATFKLTLWYMAIAMAISIAFSFAVYHFAVSELSLRLHSQTQRIFDEFPVFTSNPLLRSGRDAVLGAHHILLRLVYFNLLVFIGAGFAGYFLARRTLEPIEAAHERQKRFTADVSHELRTPLTSLKMSSEVALMDTHADKKTLREALESNLEDAGKMDMLIASLLRLTKLDADEVQAAFSLQDSRPIIDAAALRIQKAADAKHITIKREDANPSVCGDADSLVQLLVILLDNAVKYSPERSTIHILSKQDSQKTQIIIKDEGQGIAAEALPHVFDRFYRADASRTKAEADGFGLGLSIAKLISDRHHGDLTLTSRPGKGTTATLSLPAPPDLKMT